jgi:hypothetical protein
MQSLSLSNLFPYGCFLNTNFIGLRVRGELGFSTDKCPRGGTDFEGGGTDFEGQGNRF